MLASSWEELIIILHSASPSLIRVATLLILSFSSKPVGEFQISPSKLCISLSILLKTCYKLVKKFILLEFLALGHWSYTKIVPSMDISHPLPSQDGRIHLFWIFLNPKLIANSS
jgi:hypothetical protein